MHRTSRITRGLTRALVPAALGLGLLAAASPSSAATPPVAPAGLTANYLVGGATLTWTDAATDETGFVVERCIGSGCTAFGQIATVGPDVTSFVDGYAPDGVSRFRVRAVNTGGSSAPSNVADLFVLSSGGVTPRITTAGPTTGAAPLTVTFDASSTFSLNGVIGTYDWSFGDGGTASGPVVTYTFTTPGTYAATMEATATVFAANNSTSVLVTVTAPLPTLVAPSNLAASTAVRGRVALTWTNPASTTTSLRVERCRGTGCTTFTRLATVTPTTTGYTDTTARKGTVYRYRLVATDGIATAASNVVSVTAR